MDSIKTLVVYYSFSGNSSFIAEIIKDEINAEILELKPVKELNKDSNMRFLWGGQQSMMKLKPALEPYDKVPENYELIIIGTPVWAWNFSPPIRSFLKNHDFDGKKVAFFCTYSGSDQRAREKLRKILEKKGAKVISETSFLDPQTKNKENNVKKAKEWISSILK